MAIPAQSRHVAGNLRERLIEEHKALRKIRVLALNSYASSWVQDAKTCARIYVRMLKSRAVCPRILPLLSRWAALLLHYAPYYGFSRDKSYVVCRRPTIHQANEWLRRLLEEISTIHSAADLYGQRVRAFAFGARDASSYLADVQPYCAITHRSIRDYRMAAQWVTTLEDGTSTLSLYTGSNVFGWLERMIMNGLKRHGSTGFRDKLIEKIRKRNKT